MKTVLFLPLLLMVVTISQAQTWVKYSNEETSDYSTSMKSDDHTYLVWDRNDDGDGHFIDESTPNFFYWDNDDSKLHYLIDTGNMGQLNATFNSLGVGTDNPSDPLHVYEPANGSGTTLRLDADVNENPNLLFSVNGQKVGNIRINDDGNDQLQFQVGSSLLDAMSITPTGEVGIGTINPTELLTVNGTAKAKEIIVEENVGADFVFAKDYKLPSLSKVEQHIKANKHLPDIPSAQEMIANGVKVGELQMKLLQKIEELTLYVIELTKRNNVLTKKYEKQQNEIRGLKKAVNTTKTNK